MLIALHHGIGVGEIKSEGLEDEYRDQIAQLRLLLVCGAVSRTLSRRPIWRPMADSVALYFGSLALS